MKTLKIYFLKEEIRYEDFENQKLINIILNEQYIEDMKIKEKYNNLNNNKCEKCNKNNKEKGFDLCKLCINEMLDNECIKIYQLCVKEKIEFDIKNIKFEYDYSFDELFKFSKYYPNIENYIDYIKSKIYFYCKNIMEKSYNQLRCGCYQCEKCYSFIEKIISNRCKYCTRTKKKDKCSII